ncbi:hypothetical protein C8Q73DRAFT_668703 [Cubamyces lactineus]|nr:hypothetical protein C8Q73DRAFT_668703 [Cubamyces lactineus]
MTPRSAIVCPPNSPQCDDLCERTPEDVGSNMRDLARTPSPTPSEAEVLHPKKKRRPGILLNLLDPSNLKDPKELIRALVTFAIIGLVVLFIIYQQRIVEWLRPFADWMRRTRGGWLVPIVILIVMSFPPLFGHEIIAVLCGDVWGVGIGFAIVAAGTLLGELANFFVFKWFCMSRGKKWEDTRLQYALLSEVVRQGGFKIAVIVRLSAIPGHLTTAIFALCGMNVFVFLGAAILSLPKQLVTVYLGVAQSGATVSSKTKIVKTVIIALTVVLTMFAMHYIRARTDKVREVVIYRRRKARQAKLRTAAGLDADPELGLGPTGPASYPPDAVTPMEEPVKLDVIPLQAPHPQYASSSQQPPAYESAPSTPSYDSRAQPAAGGTWQLEKYPLEIPELGYVGRGRTLSRSPQPSPTPYGSAEGEMLDPLSSGGDNGVGGKSED